MALLLLPAPLLKADELVTFWPEGLETAKAEPAIASCIAAVNNILISLSCGVDLKIVMQKMANAGQFFVFQDTWKDHSYIDNWDYMNTSKSTENTD